MVAGGALFSEHLDRQQSLPARRATNRGDCGQRQTRLSHRGGYAVAGWAQGHTIPGVGVNINAVTANTEARCPLPILSLMAGEDTVVDPNQQGQGNGLVRQR